MLIPWTPKGGPLCYLATPYSKYRPSIEAAFIDASKLAATLLRAGVKVYSPIAHTHPIAVYGKIDPLDHAIWLPFDEAMMDIANVLIVARMDGWEASRGIAHEVDFFTRQGKPVYDLCPKSLIMTRRP
jgi:nucleoside 2-deoxyribosyltransferase